METTLEKPADFIEKLVDDACDCYDDFSHAIDIPEAYCEQFEVEVAPEWTKGLILYLNGEATETFAGSLSEPAEYILHWSASLDRDGKEIWVSSGNDDGPVCYDEWNALYTAV